MNDTVVSTAAIPTRVPREPGDRRGAIPAGSARGPVVRPMRAGEARDVRRIFRATLLLGRPLPIDGGDLYAYESLCLDWYLVNGTVLVAEQDGRIQGYLLACLDHERYVRWAEPRARRWGRRVLAKIALGELRGDERRFALLRIRDGLETWRTRLPAPYRAHAHLNLDSVARGASTGARLIAAMDELVDAAGLDGWFGELNVVRERSLRVFEHAGAQVVHRQHNHTFSWLLGRPVQRATIARPLAGRTGRTAAAARAGRDGDTDPYPRTIPIDAEPAMTA